MAEIDTFRRGNPAPVARERAINRLLLHLARGQSVKALGRFFPLLALCLAKVLRVHYAIVGELVENHPGRVRALGFVAARKIQKNFSYSLSHSPCQQVIKRGKICFYRSGLQKRFPRDALLRKMRAESYRGIPLLNSQKKVIGLIAAIDLKVLQDPAEDLWLLRVAASRAASEIERKTKERKLKETQSRLSALTGRFVCSQENERREVMRELHDRIGQELVLLQMKLRELRALCKAKTEQLLYEETRAVLDGIVKQVRKLILSLHPQVLEDLGLQAAVRWYLRTQGGQLGIAARVRSRLWNRRPERVIETVCYRVIVEALDNIRRHARAKNAEVTLQKQSKGLALRIRDDGVGFGVTKVFRSVRGRQKAGLAIMRERVKRAGGRLSIVSGKGKGTEIRARFPNAFQ